MRTADLTRLFPLDTWPGMSAPAGPLPSADDWREYMDAATGVPYYHSVKLRRTSWTKPAGWDEGTARQCKESRPKPHVLQRCGDWVCAVDADSGAPYFVNRRTKQARWDPPPEWPTSSSPLAEEEAPAQLRICPMKAQASNTVGPLTPIFRPREADNLPPSVSDPALSARRPSSLLAAATPPTSRASTLVFPSLAFLPRPPRFQGAEKHFRSQKSDTVVQGPLERKVPASALSFVKKKVWKEVYCILDRSTLVLEMYDGPPSGGGTCVEAVAVGATVASAGEVGDGRWEFAITGGVDVDNHRKAKAVIELAASSAADRTRWLGAFG